MCARVPVHVCVCVCAYVRGCVLKKRARNSLKNNHELMNSRVIFLLSHVVFWSTPCDSKREGNHKVA